MTENNPGAGGDWAAPGAGSPPPGWSVEQPPPAPPPGNGGWGPGWGAYAAPPPPRPGIIPLRPLGVGEILDGAFTAIRRYPRATLGLAAVVMLAVTLINIATEYWLLAGIEPPAPNATLSQAGGYAARIGTAAIVSLVISLVATLLLTGMVTAVVGEAVLGRPVTAADAWQRVRPLFWRLLGLTLLSFIIVTAVVVAAFIPSIIAFGLGGGDSALTLLILGSIVGLLLGFWLYVKLALAPAALVLERQTIRGAIRRSWTLVRTSWWRVFWILLLAALIAGVVGSILSVPFSLLGGGLTGIGGRTTSIHFTNLVLTGIGGLLSSTIVRPFDAGVAALLYLDRRMRAEALDVTLVRATEQPQA